MDGNFRLPPGNVAQILMHEMGHVLGLDESKEGVDVMFWQMHRRRYADVNSIRPSRRDVQSLTWLYNQGGYVPIRGAHG